MTTSETALAALKAWILSIHPELGDVPMDLDLISSRVVDSLMFLELVDRLGDLTGQALDPQRMPLESFNTLGALQRSYLSRLDQP